MTNLTNSTTQNETKTNPAQRCPMHRMWMRKGQCEICRLEADKLQRAREQLTGSSRQEVKITKL